MKELTYGVLGGDMRQQKLAQALQSQGKQVALWGFDQSPQPQIQQKEQVLSSDVIILPLPVTPDGVHIHMPLSKESMTFEELLEQMPQESLAVGGNLPENVKLLSARAGRELVDYFERGELKIRNSVPTVEGAVQIAMEEMGITLHGCRALVLGYGRIGKLLCHTLGHLGCHVTAAARKYSDLAWIRCFGYEGVPFATYSQHLGEYDVIFNTVPQKVLTGQELREIKKDALIIDLASKPGGVDMEAAREAGVRCIWALSLPGKVAPVTSGEIILETVEHILEERGMCPWKKGR